MGRESADMSAPWLRMERDENRARYADLQRREDERIKVENMITLTRNLNGSITASAFVTDGTSACWLESRTYYGYDREEIKPMFRTDLKSDGLKATEP